MSRRPSRHSVERGNWLRETQLSRSIFHLSYPLPSGPADETSFEVEISGASEFWLPIVLNTPSEQAYILGLKSKFICGFATPTTVRVKCDGRDTVCEAFKEHLESLWWNISTPDDTGRRRRWMEW
jgi:hypothetical protein